MSLADKRACSSGLYILNLVRFFRHSTRVDGSCKKVLCVYVSAFVYILVTAGCATVLVGAAAGAGGATAVYIKGDLEAHVDADPRELAEASTQALDALGIKTISSNASALDAEVIGRTGTDKRVKVVGQSQEQGGTKLSIRVGTFGNESMSRKAYREILTQLPD